MVRITNIAIIIVLVFVLGLTAYRAFDPVETANKKRDADLKTYWTRIDPVLKEYFDQMYILDGKVCFTPKSNYVRKGSCNQSEVYSLSSSSGKLESVACGLDTPWPVGGDPWVICTTKNEDD